MIELLRKFRSQNQALEHTITKIGAYYIPFIRSYNNSTNNYVILLVYSRNTYPIYKAENTIRLLYITYI